MLQQTDTDEYTSQPLKVREHTVRYIQLFAQEAITFGIFLPFQPPRVLFSSVWLHTGPQVQEFEDMEENNGNL